MRYLSVFLFVLAFLAVYPSWQLAPLAATWYALASLLCCIVYGIDKRAAVAGGRRIPEATLLWLGVCGGWPGAVLGQQWWRHKRAKPAFLRRFWGTVLFNCALLAYIALPLRISP